jgi:hypothetical protein
VKLAFALSILFTSTPMAAAPGRYRIAATFREETQRRDITVAADKATVLQLYWDDPASQAEGRSRRPEGFHRY